MARMSQKGWGLRTWTSVVCLATHRKIQKRNTSFDFLQDLRMWCAEATENESPKTDAPRKTLHQNDPELTRLALKQMKDLGLTAIPSDTDSRFVLMKLSDVSAQQ